MRTLRERGGSWLRQPFEPRGSVARAVGARRSFGSIRVIASAHGAPAANQSVGGIATALEGIAYEMGPNVAEQGARGRNHHARCASVAEWSARAAFAVVFSMNVLCALQFLIAPESYAPVYELYGASGAAAVQGMGVTFLMWNATYPPYIARPARFPVLGWVIVVQQAVGLLGETFILAGLPAGHMQLAGGIERFVAFDAGGLALLLAAHVACVLAHARSEADQAKPTVL